MRHLSRGFTLIEMIIVIVVLGIIAVTAAPRFLNVSSDSRIAALDGFVGAFRAADEMVRSKAIMHGMEYTLERTQLPGTDLYVIFGHMNLKKEDVEKAMDVSGYSLLSVTDNSLFVSLRDDIKSSEDLSKLSKHGCYLFIKLPRPHNNEDGEITGNLLDHEITKIYDGC